MPKTSPQHGSPPVSQVKQCTAQDNRGQMDLIAFAAKVPKGRGTNDRRRHEFEGDVQFGEHAAIFGEGVQKGVR